MGAPVLRIDARLCTVEPWQLSRTTGATSGPQLLCGAAALMPLGQHVLEWGKHRTSSAARLRMGGVPTWKRRMPGAGSYAVSKAKGRACPSQPCRALRASGTSCGTAQQRTHFIAMQTLLVSAL